jgi:hypothetical protein
VDTLTGIDLTGVVITGRALHTQREHVTDLHARGAHWVRTGLRPIHPEIEGFSITAGNSSGINDAAAALGLASSDVVAAEGPKISIR